jgi:quinol monooxygenase YgiN
MAVLVTIKGRLREDPDAIKKIHDTVTTATKEMALQAGDISHRVYLNPQDGRDFLGIDEWQSAEAVAAFSANRSDDLAEPWLERVVNRAGR